MITLNVSATEMCARNDTVVIPLDSTITWNSSGNNNTEWLWWLKFSYGTIYGSAACLSKKEVMMYSDWNGSGNLAGGFPLNTSSDELVGSQGYYMNADTNSDIPDSEKADYARIYCFWKMTHPLSSNWAYMSTHNPPVGPVWGCDVKCINATFSDAIRKRLFNSIGTVPPWTE